MKPPQRILIRSVNWLGDAVMSTPALVRLREAFPPAHVSLLTHEKLADLWHGHPAVDEVLMFAPDESVWKVGRELRAQDFELALVLPNSPRSALEVWLARIPARIGYAGGWRRWLLTRAVAPRAGAMPMRKRSDAEICRLTSKTAGQTEIENRQFQVANSPVHHLHQYLHLVASLGADPTPLAPQLVVTDQEVDAFTNKFGLADAGANLTWLGLNAGAEYGPAKRWPLERFAAAAVELHRQTGCGCLVFGGQSDLELARRLAGQIGTAASDTPIINVAGCTSLRELCAGLKRCGVLLTNDSGPMHVAAALGTPVVVPFGSTSPELTGPGLPGDPAHRLLRTGAPCSPCFRRACPIDFRCMHGISVEQVVSALLEVVRARPRG